MLSATAQSTEWMVTKTMLAVPSPNHGIASGSSAMAGRGLNIAVQVERKSAPMRCALAHSTRAAERARPTV